MTPSSSPPASAPLYCTKNCRRKKKNIVKTIDSEYVRRRESEKNCSRRRRVSTLQKRLRDFFPLLIVYRQKRYCYKILLKSYNTYKRYQGTFCCTILRGPQLLLLRLPCRCRASRWKRALGKKSTRDHHRQRPDRAPHRRSLVRAHPSPGGVHATSTHDCSRCVTASLTPPSQARRSVISPASLRFRVCFFFFCAFRPFYAIRLSTLFYFLNVSHFLRVSTCGFFTRRESVSGDHHCSSGG